MAGKSEAQPRKRGTKDLILVLLSVAMIFSPSYLSDIMVGRLKVPISGAAIFALVLFLAGIFLLLKQLRD